MGMTRLDVLAEARMSAKLRLNASILVNDLKAAKDAQDELDAIDGAIELERRREGGQQAA